MGDKYQAGQAGAVGPNAQAHDLTLSQTWNRLEGTVDLNQLAEELAKLRQEMKKEAVEIEHDISVAAIGEAHLAAVAGDGSKTIEHLRSAGRWAFDVAVKIGIPLAVEVLKESLDLNE